MKSTFLNICATGLALTAFLAVTSTAARADIITSLQSQSQSAGMWDYTFNVFLTGDEQVSTSLSYSQFGTLYDLSSSAVTPTNITGDLATDFTFSSSQISTGNQAYLTGVPNGNGYDLRYTFNGAVDSTLMGPQQLGTFTIAVNSPLSMVWYDGEAGKSTGTPGNETGNLGSINITPASNGVPEPASLLLIGGGLLGLGFIGRRARKDVVR